MGPGSDLSEVLVWGCEPAALDFSVAPLSSRACRLRGDVVVQKGSIDDVGQASFELSGSSPGGELLFCVVAGGVVGDVGCPASPDHSDPAAGEDTDGVGVSGAA
jgi:hypothetical protein